MTNPNLEEEAEALLKIVVAMAYADSHLVELEEQAVCAKIRRFRGFEDIRDDNEKLQLKVNSLFDDDMSKIAIDRLISEAAEYFVKERKIPELSEAAYAHAVDVAATDGVVKKIERQVLDELAYKLQIDDDRRDAIYDVVLTMCNFYYKDNPN